MNEREQRRQARELLELEIKLARLKVQAARIKRQQARQSDSRRRAEWLALAETAAAAAADGWGRKAAFAATPRKSRWLWLAAWAAWQFARQRVERYGTSR